MGNHGSSEQDKSPAEIVYEEYLGMAASGGEPELDAFCDEHPDLADELRLLHAQFQCFAPNAELVADALQNVETERDGRTESSFFRPGGARAKRQIHAEPLIPIAQPGAAIGDFRLNELLGSGGMGQVWDAEQVSLGRHVALKLIRPESVSEKSIKFFAREARAGGKLSHPGIVVVLAHGETDGLHWIALELVEDGWTLRDFIDEMRNEPELPPDYNRRMAVLATDLADALQHAHDRGVIHRDLKPRNVLITADGKPKITDFGLAKISLEPSISKTGDFAGTYYYMSPEQVTARQTELDHRSDIFSLGVVLYEMLTLQRPFEGDTTAQVAAKIVSWDPPDLRRRRSRIPEDLAVICGKALEKRREERYQTMGELGADLRRHLANEPILATPPGMVGRIQKWGQRHPTKAVAGAVAVLAFVVISVLLVVNVRTGRELARANESLLDEKQATEAALTTTEHQRDRAEDAEKQANRNYYSTLLLMMRAALDEKDIRTARSLHTRCPENLRDWEWAHLGLRIDQFTSGSWDDSLRVWDAASGHGVQLQEGDERRFNSVAWSPDGTRIASTAADRLCIWHAASGVELQILDGRGSPMTSVAWSPDGQQVASGYRIWNATSGENLQTLEGFTDIVSCVAWSPDGRWVASGLCYTGLLCIWDPVSGHILHYLEVGDGLLNSVSWSPDGTRIATCQTDDTGRSQMVEQCEGTLLIWHAVSGKKLQVLEDLHEKMLSVAWSPDGKRIASGAANNTLFISDATTGERLQTMGGNRGAARSVAWNPDGNRIVVASEDGTLRIWDTLSGANLLSLEGHQASVTSVAWSPDGARIVSASIDNTLRLWESRTEDVEAISHAADRRRRVHPTVVPERPELKYLIPAWALFTNGLYDEAIAEADRVIALVPEDCRAEYQKHVDRYHAMIEEARAVSSRIEDGDDER